jgi:hypothetical protein
LGYINHFKNFVNPVEKIDIQIVIHE